MKKGLIKKITCLALTVALGLTMTGTGVFATEGSPDQTAAEQVAEESISAAEDVAAAEEQLEVVEEETEAAEPADGTEATEPDRESEPVNAAAAEFKLLSKTLNSANPANATAWNVKYSTSEPLNLYEFKTDGTATLVGAMTFNSAKSECSATLQFGKLYIIKQQTSGAELYFLSGRIWTSKLQNGTATLQWTKFTNIPSDKKFVIRNNLNGAKTQYSLDTTTAKFDLNDAKSRTYSLLLTGDYDTPVIKTGAIQSKCKVKITDALRDYKGVTLKWSTSGNDNIKGYKIYRSGKLVKTVTGKSTKKAYVKGAPADVKKSYRICAMYNAGGVTDKSASVKQRPVRTLYVYVYTKTYKSLKAHDGSGKTASFSKGTKIKTDGFGSGKYKFHYNGALFYLNRTSTYGAYCDYDKKHEEADYTVEEATNYVNHRGLTSSTSKLIWASYYCQRVYIFKKSDGKWKIISDGPDDDDATWKISTGKASSPSPTGLKKIHDHIYFRHHLYYWSCYSTLNAFHSVTAQSWKDKLGNPASGGCIRNLKHQAKWIYDKVPTGTRVLCY